SAAGFLQTQPATLTIAIEGHVSADEAAIAKKADGGKRLARERAEAVRNAIARTGVDASRLKVVVVGAAAPLATNAPEAQRAASRRVTMHICSEATPCP